GFGIWPTLSAPVQIRIGILNLLTQSAITEIVTRFAQAMNDIGAQVDIDEITADLETHYQSALAA
ncbi:MAG: aminotransferase, partial [Sulfitobacter sp.]|nr:aminotransferase [Sulfitobacter sp.]